MKKYFLFVLCLGLGACDNNAMVGKCLPNERSTTTTEQNGKIIERKISTTWLCGCFENKESVNPQFMISKDEFSFETSDSETFDSEIENVEYFSITKTVSVNDDESQDYKDRVCDKKCTYLCRKK